MATEARDKVCLRSWSCLELIYVNEGVGVIRGSKTVDGVRSKISQWNLTEWSSRGFQNQTWFAVRLRDTSFTFREEEILLGKLGNKKWEKYDRTTDSTVEIQDELPLQII